jgi:membrane associated rhomboid family serine protease
MAKDFNWSGYTGIMALLIPAVITVFNFALFYRVIPAGFTLDYVILSSASPNVVSMFFSNFAHVDVSHLSENMIAYFTTIGAIVVIALFGIPRSGLKYTLDAKILVQSTVIFLLVVPFIISGASLLVAPYIGMEKNVGFSGIVFAFFGYIVYILENLLLLKVKAVKERKQAIFGYALIVLIIVIPIIVMNSTIHTNYVGHFTGFVSGITIPFILTAAQKN